MGLAFIDISVDFQSKFYSNSHKQSTKQRNYISDQPKRCLQKTKLMEFKILKHLQLELPGSNPQSRRKCSTCRNLSVITDLWTPTSEGSIAALLQCCSAEEFLQYVICMQYEGRGPCRASVLPWETSIMNTRYV